MIIHEDEIRGADKWNKLGKFFRMNNWIDKLKSKHLITIYYLLVTLSLRLVPTCSDITTYFIIAKIFFAAVIISLYEITECLNPVILLIDSINLVCLLAYLVWDIHNCNDTIIMITLTISMIERIVIILIMMYVSPKFQ